VAIDLFDRRGFDDTSVDEVATAAGIARRTLFRYYPSKNAIAWGDCNLPLAEALARALVDFNDVPESQAPRHRRRMRLLLTVPALQAHSMLMYADWRHVVADYAAMRLDVGADDLAAYDQWLADPGEQGSSQLHDLLVEGSGLLAVGIDAALSPTGTTMR